ncbi:conserved hypothetical protein [Thiomonas sp. CB3]|nr:conserved hypothetical protein [Thiomonas sp. CB3]
MTHPTETPAWMRAEVIAGLQRLVSLALPGQPPAETIVLTAATWCDALSLMPIAWDAQQDAPRLRAAFAALLPQIERWPAPVALLRNLPARAAAPVLPPPRINPANRAHLRESLERLRVRLTAKP